MMKNDKSNILLYGLILGGIVGAGLAIYYGSRFIKDNNKKKRERKNKFYEGIDDIFDSSPENIADADTQIDKEAEKGIVDELFSRSK